MKKQKRQTIARAITKAKTTKDKIEIALYGREQNAIEKATRQYLFSRWGMLQCEKAGQAPDNPDRAGFTAATETTGTDLARIMFNAIDTGNGTTLREIADEVDRFKPFPGLADQSRAHLLTLKDILDSRGDTMPLRKVAELVRYPWNEADGGSGLRQLCKSINFPLAPMKRGPK